LIRIIDYGVGNIQAFLTLFKRQGIAAARASTIEELQDATRLILPGVGHFDHAMTQLNNSGMRDTLDKMVLEDLTPVIGICVGMQMMANSSDEGTLEGLKWIDASVRKFDESTINQITRLPHMGWNDVQSVNDSKLFDGMHDAARFYFLHSYYIACENKEQVVGTAAYPDNFVCAVNNKNIYGVQFHPEKSHQFGVNLLDNFYKL